MVKPYRLDFVKDTTALDSFAAMCACYGPVEVRCFNRPSDWFEADAWDADY
ncbi:hypothetical protein [Stratiformator vulcanicus]|uniref:Uncharacterized protein n=1 Tax=Stratiformator vulcanicus TaxID=2527980 RepID=A0A517R3D6_9PLAN|nr:hypothetical protein [Stratiformator vulcanicus]QDT38409.1 hypothetical protein Pan189_28020 [Stratiformator vulcanicus]